MTGTPLNSTVSTTAGQGKRKASSDVSGSKQKKRHVSATDDDDDDVPASPSTDPEWGTKDEPSDDERGKHIQLI